MQVNDDMVRAAVEAAKNVMHALPYVTEETYDEKLGAVVRAALTAALAHMWRPIEGAPKDGRYIIVGRFRDSALKWVKHSRWMICDEAAERDGGEPEDYDDGWTDGDDEDDYCEPTHFMPLPAPPKTGGE